VRAEQFVLCGYSMGGRIALHVATTMPERLSRLVLVSTSAGIEDDAERAARRRADELLAQDLESGTTERFIERWRKTPLFAGDPAWVQDAAATDTRRLTAKQIAAMLRAFSAGTLDPLWGSLGKVALPVAVLAGERDRAYCEIGARLAQGLPRAGLRIVPGAGHRVALEAPEAVLAAVRSSRAAKS
jgi:2-succinyl-6-hydroxy-2,4-cyclohexadiene-1-carboxylate synthase